MSMNAVASGSHQLAVPSAGASPSRAGESIGLDGAWGAYQVRRGISHHAEPLALFEIANGLEKRLKTFGSDQVAPLARVIFEGLKAERDVLARRTFSWESPFAWIKDRVCSSALYRKFFPEAARRYSDAAERDRELVDRTHALQGRLAALDGLRGKYTVIHYNRGVSGFASARRELMAGIRLEAAGVEAMRGALLNPLDVDGAGRGVVGRNSAILKAGQLLGHLTARIDTVERLGAAHAAQAAFEKKLDVIVDPVLPRFHGEFDAYNPSRLVHYRYADVAMSYLDNRDGVLAAFEALLRQEAGSGDIDALRQRLTLAARDGGRALMVGRMMIDLNRKLAPDDPLRRLVDAPLRDTRQRLDQQVGVWARPDFLSLSNDPERCLERAAEAASTGGWWMDHWLFLAAGAVPAGKAAAVAAGFDGGRRVVEEAGNAWAGNEQIGTMPRLPKAAGGGPGARLEEALRKAVHRLAENLRPQAEDKPARQAREEPAAQAFKRALLDRLDATTGGVSGDGALRSPVTARGLVSREVRNTLFRLEYPAR